MGFAAFHHPSLPVLPASLVIWAVFGRLASDSPSTASDPNRHRFCPSRYMPSGRPSNVKVKESRDLRIDWLRGLAMICVIVNHSRISSLLSWFSYERFWVVTAAEVFVVLSGTVLGMVYGRRLVRDGWLVVVRGLGRRALTLYGAFVLVTLSVLVISLAGIDVSSITAWDDRATG